MFGRVFSALAIVATLTGCQQHFAAQDDAKCQSFGAQPGTQAYFDCRMAMDGRRSQAIRQAGANLSAAGARLGDKGQGAPSRSVTCSSQRIGSRVDTTCD